MNKHYETYYYDFEKYKKEADIAEILKEKSEKQSREMDKDLKNIVYHIQEIDEIVDAFNKKYSDYARIDQLYIPDDSWDFKDEYYHGQVCDIQIVTNQENILEDWWHEKPEYNKNQTIFGYECKYDLYIDYQPYYELYDKDGYPIKEFPISEEEYKEKYSPLAKSNPYHKSLVYFISNGRAIKIGKTSNIHQRLSNLQTSSPDQLNLIGVIYTSDNTLLENKVHNYFKEKRINGEWFNISREEVIKYMDYLQEESI